MHRMTPACESDSRLRARRPRRNARSRREAFRPTTVSEAYALQNSHAADDRRRLIEPCRRCRERFAQQQTVCACVVDRNVLQDAREMWRRESDTTPAMTDE